MVPPGELESKESIQGKIWAWLIPLAPVAFELPSNLTWDDGIQGIHADIAAHLLLSGDTKILTQSGKMT